MDIYSRLKGFSILKTVVFLVLLIYFPSLDAQTFLVDTVLSGSVPSGDLIVSGDVTFVAPWDLNRPTTVVLRGGGVLNINGGILGDNNCLFITSDSLIKKPQVFFHGSNRRLKFSELNIQNLVYHELDSSLADTFALVDFSDFSNLNFDKLVIRNNRYSKSQDRSSTSIFMKGALSLRNVKSILIDSLYSCNNLAQGLGGGVYVSNVDTFTMLNSRHHQNTAQDTFVVSPTQLNTVSNGGGALRVDRGGTCVVRNAIVTGDTSFYAIGLFCDSVNVSNMHISSSPGTYASYDNESLKPHIYTHVSITEGFSEALANHANDVFINSVLTGRERPNRDIGGYVGPSNRTVTYVNTAINYDCGGNCAGTIPLSRGDVPMIPVLDECSTDEFIGPLLTPNANSPLINRASVIEGFERDLFGNMRGFGGLADLGAVEYIGIVSTQDPVSILDLSVFPNPASEFLRYKLADSAEAISKIRLVSTIGKIVMEFQVSSNEDVLTLDSGITSGLYFLQFQMLSGGVFTKSIMIK